MEAAERIARAVLTMLNLRGELRGKKKYLEAMTTTIKQEMGPQPGDAVYVLEADNEGSYFLGCTRVVYAGESRFGLSINEWVSKDKVFPYTEAGHAAAQAEADRLNAEKKGEQ